MRILVAEDDRTSLAMLERTLRQWGHEVITATDGDKAWELFQSHPVTMVISDWVMPGMAGTELCRAVRDHTESPYTFFILLTARDDRSSLLEAFEAGVDDFIAKPFDPGELRARLRVGERTVELETALARRIEELDSANRKMRRDLQAAVRIQESLLPEHSPDSTRVRFAWHLRPCADLAGDLLNVFPLGEDRFGMYVLDVSGHGVPASLMSVMLSRLLFPGTGSSILFRKRGRGESILAPHEVLEELNRRFQIESSPGGRYFTITYCILDAANHRLQYAVAGHPPPLWHEPGAQPRVLPGDGLPIGFDKAPAYKSEEIALTPGGRLFLYSDGVLDTESPSGELFNEEGLARSVSDAAAAPLAETVQAILQAAERWSNGAPPLDDMSLLASELIAPPS